MSDDTLRHDGGWSDRNGVVWGHSMLTDAERDDLRVWLAECLRQASAATEGGNEELAERWLGRSRRAAALLERLGGGYAH